MIEISKLKLNLESDEVLIVGIDANKYNNECIRIIHNKLKEVFNTDKVFIIDKDIELKSISSVDLKALVDSDQWKELMSKL